MSPTLPTISPTTAMETNARPSYTVRPYIIPETGSPVEGLFAIDEHRNGETRLIAKVHYLDGWQDILKRGIPYEDAMELHYQICKLSS